MNRLSKAKFPIIDELSIVLSNLRTDIDSKGWEKYILMITQKAFAGLSVMTVPDFPQLLPVS